jgi:uncharacterized integral membrane protein
MAVERPGDYLMPVAPDDDRPRVGTYFDVMFTVVVFLTCAFSTWTTYLGFSYDIPKMLAAFLSIVIGLCLIAINFKIREARRSAMGLTRPLIAFAIVFVFSFVSNTNAIYSYFIQRDIVGQTQEEAWRVFDSETNKILKAIAEVPAVASYEDRQRQLRVARQNLKTQIVDSRNPGFGELAQAHYAEIMKILGINLTPLRAPDATAPIEQLQGYAQRLDDLIDEQAEVQFRADPAAPLIEFGSGIQRVRAFYENKMREKEYAADTTDLMTRDLDGYAVKARDLLPGELDLQRINNTADEIGAFQYTWRNFLNWINPVAIVLSVLLGALLDVLVPLLSILLYRPDLRY